MVQWLRAFAVLAKDLGSMPSTHISAHNIYNTSPIWPLHTYTMHTYTCRQNTHIHEIKKKSFKNERFWFLVFIVSVWMVTHIHVGALRPGEGIRSPWARITGKVRSSARAVCALTHGANLSSPDYHSNVRDFPVYLCFMQSPRANSTRSSSFSPFPFLGVNACICIFLPAWANISTWRAEADIRNHSWALFHLLRCVKVSQAGAHSYG